MNNTATREELKAILDAWIPKYIRQVVELRSGSKLSAERYNELMNLLITQGDDTIELAEVVKQYVELLVEDVSTEFADTTDEVLKLSNTAIATANSAVNSVAEYRTLINNDITAFKEVVNQATAEANATADEAVATANQLVTDMESYRVDLSTQVEETFRTMMSSLSARVDSEVAAQTQEAQEALTAAINEAFNTLSSEVTAVANNAVQIANGAVEDVAEYKTDMDVRLDEALKEVEESLSVAGEVIQDAAAIYTKLDEIDAAVQFFEGRLATVEEDVTALEEGTKQVGNAKKLDGHGAEYFAPLTYVNALGHKFNIVSLVNDMNTVPVYTAGIVYVTAQNVPSDMNKGYGGYGLFYTIGFSNAYQIQRIVCSRTIHERTINNNVPGEWETLATAADLAKYLLLTGGYITGAEAGIGSASSETGFTWGLKNAKRFITEQILSDGTYRIRDTNNAKNIITSTVDGTNTFNGTASGNVASVDGTAYLASHGGFTIQRTGGVVCAPKYVGNGNTLGYLGFSEAGKPVFIDTNGSYRDILHTGNMASHVLSLNGGGTVSADNTTPVRLKNTSGNRLYIQCLGPDNTNLGYLGFANKDRPVFVGSDASTIYNLLHTGNGATYEEGTFDLTLEGRTLSGYKYTKIGNFVYLSGTVAFNGEPLTIENTTVEVHGLPFGISSVPYIYFGDAVYSPSNKATNNLVNYVPGGTYFGIGGNGTISFAVGRPCILHAMYITD